MIEPVRPRVTDAVGRCGDWGKGKCKREQTAKTTSRDAADGLRCKFWGGTTSRGMVCSSPRLEVPWWVWGEGLGYPGDALPFLAIGPLYAAAPTERRGL